MDKNRFSNEEIIVSIGGTVLDLHNQKNMDKGQVLSMGQ